MQQPANQDDKLRRDTEAANQQEDQDFPGYPHYPKNEDILRTDATRVSMDIEQMGNARKPTAEQLEGKTTQQGPEVPKPLVAAETESTGDADLSPDDLAILEATTQNRDLDDTDPEQSLLDQTDLDGDPLNEVTADDYSLTGSDLDVPGSETDDDNEAIGEEDEENNPYSLGSDDNDENESRTDSL